MAALATLDSDNLLDLGAWPSSCTSPRRRRSRHPAAAAGYRLLSQIPRLPESIVDGIVEHFGSLPKIMRATIEDLEEVDGVGECGPVRSRTASPA